jgi:hypothetical protein
MRIGDCSVEIIAPDGGAVRELPSGHVLARPGQIYVIRLRNLGPLRALAEVRIDGHNISAGGLVLDPWSSVDLERPVDDSAHGRFTVIAEGDESVFGPDGGRDNPDLGVIEVRFRRELPRSASHTVVTPLIPTLEPRPLPHERSPSPEPHGFPGRSPAAPPEWMPPSWSSVPSPLGAPAMDPASGRPHFLHPTSLMTTGAPVAIPRAPVEIPDSVERAAGTGLTGESTQRFIPTSIGPLETAATIIRLRIVIGSPSVLGVLLSDEPLQGEAPPRPAARP